jgi:hypothetical protein
MYAIVFKKEHMFLGPQFGRMTRFLGSISTTIGMDAHS